MLDWDSLKKHPSINYDHFSDQPQASTTPVIVYWTSAFFLTALYGIFDLAKLLFQILTEMFCFIVYLIKIFSENFVYSSMQ
jgi:hypothetical protein